MALFNKTQLKAVVLIELKNRNKFFPLGTGFLIGFSSEHKGQKGYRIFLITNRHVFEGQEEVWLRFDNADGTGTSRFQIKLIDDGKTKWLKHHDKEVDIAMLTISPKVLNGAGVGWTFFNEEMISGSKSFQQNGTELGDEVFFLGFPMQLTGELQNYAIVRSGSIARIDSEIISKNKAFFIDGVVLPGNSGGPVVTKPEVASLEGTKSVNSIYLIGIVSGYLPHKELLYSHQSNPPSVAAITYENSGLALVVPMEYAKDVYDDFIRKNIPLEKESTEKKRIVDVAKSNINT